MEILCRGSIIIPLRSSLHVYQSILLRSINQYCVMKKRDLFHMNEMDHKFNQIHIFFLTIEYFRIPKLLFDGLDLWGGGGGGGDE